MQLCAAYSNKFGDANQNKTTTKRWWYGSVRFYQIPDI